MSRVGTKSTAFVSAAIEAQTTGIQSVGKEGIGWRYHDRGDSGGTRQRSIVTGLPELARGFRSDVVLLGAMQDTKPRASAPFGNWP